MPGCQYGYLSQLDASFGGFNHAHRQALNSKFGSISPARATLTLLPSGHRCGVDPELSGHRLLGEAQGLPDCDQFFGQGGGLRKRIVAEEFDDLGQHMNLGRGFVALPIPDACLVNANNSGDLSLEQFQVEPARSDMVAYAIEFLGILRNFWF